MIPSSEQTIPQASITSSCASGVFVMYSLIASSPVKIFSGLVFMIHERVFSLPFSSTG
jgi:hypothetical protein